MRKPAFGFFMEVERDTITQLNLFRLKLCFANGVDAICFHLNDLDKENETINAYVWTKDGLKREVTALPSLLEYSAGTSLRQYFRTKLTIIDDFNLSKKDINELLIKTEFSNMVIPTLNTAVPEKILDFATLWKETMVKPLTGARGEGIISIKQNADGSYIFTNAQKEIGSYTKEESIKLLGKMFGNTTVITQPRLSFKNKDGNTMDFRVNVSKNGEGEWETIFILPRTARDSIVSNIASGGYASELTPTLEIDYGENAEKVKSELDRIAKGIPPIIEEASNCNMLSLGIDVGFDYETLNPYIIEVNYIPQVHFKGSLRYYYTQSSYIAYLVEKHGLK